MVRFKHHQNPSNLSRSDGKAFLLYVDDAAPPVLENITKNPPEPLAGPMPDALKHLLPIE